MEYTLRRERRLLRDLTPAEYNPRVRLTPSDPEYQAIKESIQEFGYCDPIIINRDGTIIGGHQRATVLEDIGETEADVVVLDLNKSDEKALNIALNKIGGQWNEDLLRAALSDLQEIGGLQLATKTGYSAPDLDVVLTPPAPKETAAPAPGMDRMEFIFSLEQFADVEQAIEMIYDKYKKEDIQEYGNSNRKGTAVYRIVKEWAEQKKFL